MPRQDVPYGGALCRLRERIAEIWDKLGEKLHSINGVEGDGAGNVQIVSGDAAIVVTADQINHEVEIALDSSQLPAAAVESVNGETGAVVLDGNDIETFEGSNVSVTDAIVTNVGQLNNLQGRLNQEISDRQAGDNALQGSINSVQASIPGAAATAVSNDPTVAQLSADVPNKLDKITSGSTLKAYTHTGATQGETSVVNGTDANSIGLRDANGRMYAADPASGATDKSLVTANWVSQTGSNAPNNLIHRSGYETKSGILQFTDAPLLVNGGTGGRLSNVDLYLHFITIRSSADSNYNIAVTIYERGMLIIGSILVSVVNGIVDSVALEGKTITGSTNRIFVGASMTSEGLKIYCHSNTVNRAFYVNVLGCFASGGYPQNITPMNEVTTAPPNYIEAQFTEV